MTLPVSSAMVVAVSVESVEAESEAVSLELFETLPVGGMWFFSYRKAEVAYFCRDELR